MLKLGFLGSGQMATAIAAGLVGANYCLPEEIIMSGRDASRLEALAGATGYNVTTKNEEVVQSCDVIVLAVKPDQIIQVLGQKTLLNAWSAEKLLISIAAGVSNALLQRLRGLLQVVCPDPRLVLVMTSTACRIQEACSAYFVNGHVSPKDTQQVQEIFELLGTCIPLKTEAEFDIFTVIAGSGPAFLYTLIDGMADSGVKGGLRRDTAIIVAAQTLASAGRMVLQTKNHPIHLKDQVASPSGSTIEGLLVLEQRGFRSTIQAAISSACKRIQDLKSIVTGGA